MSKIVIRGHEFNHNPLNLDTLMIQQRADETLKESVDVESIAKNPTLDALLKVYMAVDAYFTTVLGEGSLSAILDGERDPIGAMDAYYDLRDAGLEMIQKNASSLQGRKQIPDKYNPEKLKR